MYQVEFDYPIDGKMMKILAKCKDVINEETVRGLSFTFFDGDDNIIKVEYDEGLFEDIEDEALILLSDLYYNRNELNFSQTH